MRRVQNTAEANSKNGNGQTGQQRQAQQPPRSNSSSGNNSAYRPKSPHSQRRSNEFGRVLNSIGRVVVQILRLIQFLTCPPGSAIMLGLGVLYFAALSAEGYWQAMNPDNPAFLPKPFVQDGANLLNVFIALSSASFYLATIVSFIVQGIQAMVLREIEVERAAAEAQAQYEAVAKYRVPNPDPQAIDIAEERRRKLKSVGMRTVRTKGALILLTYAIDIGIGVWNFPIAGLMGTGLFFVNFVWLLASVFGVEALINLFLAAIAPLKNAPKVEVVE